MSRTMAGRGTPIGTGTGSQNSQFRPESISMVGSASLTFPNFVQNFDAQASSRLDVTFRLDDVTEYRIGADVDVREFEICVAAAIERVEAPARESFRVRRHEEQRDALRLIGRPNS